MKPQRTEFAHIIDNLHKSDRTRLVQLLKERERNRHEIEALMRRPRRGGRRG